MTISTTSSQTVVLGNDSTATFSFPFVVDDPSDLNVIYTDALGNQTTLLPTQYTAYLNPPGANSAHSIGGTITYPKTGSPISSGTTLTIQRVLPLVQESSIQNQGDFAPTVIEGALDTLTLLIQQVSARTGAYRGTWSPDTYYNFGDVIQDGASGLNTLNIYTNIVPGTSSSSWAADLAAGDWALAINAQVLAGYASTATAGAATATAQATIATTAAASVAAGVSTVAAGVATATAEAGIATTQAGIATTQAGIATNAATGLNGTSTTGATIGTGNFTFNTQANKQFAATQWVEVASSASPTNYFVGQVSSYNQSTGALAITVPSNGAIGAGTFASWNITPSGPPGPQGAAGAAGITTNFIERTIFTANGTFTPQANTVRAYVRGKAGGGAGGGAAATSGSGFSVGAGGGEGGYFEGWLTIAQIGASQSVIVGAGATGTTLSGASGGNTTFGSLMTAGGGGGGGTFASSTPNIQAITGAGGSASGGDINSPGANGLSGISGTVGSAGGGNGGAAAVTTNTAANNGTNGGGGGGPANGNSMSARAGGNGGNGWLIVDEFAV